MYNTEQYMAPEGNYETVTTADNATWYKQYAVVFTEDSNALRLMGLLACPVMVCMALWVNCLPTAPARPPERKEDWFTLFELPTWGRPASLTPPATPAWKSAADASRARKPRLTTPTAQPSACITPLLLPRQWLFLSLWRLLRFLRPMPPRTGRTVLFCCCLPQAAQALTSYLGQTGIPDAPSYSGVEIGGGRITGSWSAWRSG